MAQQFEDQGGAATSNPSAVVRWLTSKLLSRAYTFPALERRRARAEKKRRRAGAPHRVEYFHHVADAYGHLAAQLLQPLLDHYDVELVCHLVTVEHDRNLPEPELLRDLSRYDCGVVAPHYGLRFPENAAIPAADAVALAEQILAGAAQPDFPALAVAAGDALWSGDASALRALAERAGTRDASSTHEQIERGTARRAKLGHYSGAMFHYGDEWFWGADRFHHLEGRLIALAARSDGGNALLRPRPAIETGPLKDDGSLTFEIYPSLRSPYTSIIFDEAVALAEATGVKLVVRPVLPMVMRGVSVTRSKGQYIFTDTSREAAALGLDWGRFYDPIGEPARNGYALYGWARDRGRGVALLSSFMRAAFYEGINTNAARGLRRVVERIGLPWEEAREVIGSRDWEDEVEANRLAMYAFGSWGVPSFQLLDATGAPVLGLWGQDRLWLFSREIQRLLRDGPTRPGAELEGGD